MTMSSPPAGTSEQRRDLPPIVCGVDDLYVHPFCVVMESMATADPNGVEHLRLIVLNQSLTGAGRDTILFHAARLKLSVEFREVPAPPDGYPVHGWVSSAVYLRLGIPDVITERRALYIDTDVLVLDSLRPLLAQPLFGAPFGAVRDPEIPILGMGSALRGWQELGIPEGREYFNSGVLLLDLDEIRRKNLFERAHRFLFEHPEKARYWDQDALNWAADDGWYRLKRRWNTYALSPRVHDYTHRAEHVVPLADLLSDEHTAAVLHFAGRQKPWRDDYPAGPLRDLYRRFSEAVAENETHRVTG